MNSYPNLITEAAIRYHAERVYEDLAPSRRRQARRAARRQAQAAERHADPAASRSRSTLG